jgi:hypothetical protein
MTTLLSAFFLALVTKTIVGGLLAPIKQRWPDLDLWWVPYPAWVLGGVLAWFSGIDLFAGLFPEFNPVLGRLLTALVAGGGAGMLHDIFDRPPTTSITATSASRGTMSATVTSEEGPLAQGPRVP